MLKSSVGQKGDALHILIFTRYPTPGEAKTRLIPELGKKDSARLHKRMAESVVQTARETRAAITESDVVITVFCTGARLSRFKAWLGPDLEYVHQIQGDIGMRMHKGVERAFANGAGHVLVIGADLPPLTSDILCRAFEQLNGNDLVIGPAMDGGYYLIGMNRPRAEIFKNIAWGTDKVLGVTRAKIRAMRLSFAETPVLGDVDRVEDLAPLHDDPRFAGIFKGRESLSIIIPTLNEENVLARTLEHVRSGENVEIIVADGGSEDATRRIAENSGAEVLEVAGGRAAQQNAGAKAANGLLLLFLHADTLLPDGYEKMIRNALDDPAIVAGAFAFRTDGMGCGMRLAERMTNLRSRLLQLPYGDQGLFMEKRMFNEIGGFAPMPIMEDFELVRRFRRRGNVVTLNAAAVTSARRWDRLGVFRTTIINQMMIAGFFLGVPIENLHRFYRSRVEKYRNRFQPKEDFSP